MKRSKQPHLVVAISINCTVSLGPILNHVFSSWKVGIVAMVSACHPGDPGSSPGPDLLNIVLT